MASPINAIHIRTGQRSAAERVDRWLDQHGVDAVRCTDAVEACTWILRNDAGARVLAFVGTDWLAPDELDILPILREEWPAIGIVLYGETVDFVPCECSVRTIVCGSQTALCDLMETPPEALLRRLGVTPVPSGQPTETPDPAPASPAVAEPGLSGAGEPAAETAAPQAEPSSGNGDSGELAAKTPEPKSDEPRASSAILTREELAALLKNAND